MKKMKFSLLKHAVVFLLVIFATYSCSDDPVQPIDYQETQWKIVNITVKKADWKWDSKIGRYDAIFNLPELTKFIYESGAQLGYVFIGTQGVDEVQKMLPYVHTYWEDDGEGGEIRYTETISCDFQFGNPSTVAFYIQGSDLGRDDYNLTDYNFRIVLIW